MKRFLSLFALLLMPLSCLAQFSWPTYPVTSKVDIYKVMKDNGSGVAIKATNDSTAFLGINQNAVVTSTGNVQILTSGPSQVLVGATPVTRGAFVTSDANGNVVPYNPTQDGAIHCYLGTVIPSSGFTGAASTYVYVNVSPACSRTSGGGGPPSGAAGGDLSGTYPNPTVAQVNGAAVPTSAALLGTNASKQIVSASLPASATILGSNGTPALVDNSAATLANTISNATSVTTPLITMNGNGCNAANRVVFVLDGAGDFHCSPSFTFTNGTGLIGGATTTQSPLDNSTNLASTAYVDAAVSVQVQTASGSVTSAQIKSFSCTLGTPITVISAPGAGKYIHVLDFSYKYTGATTAYAAGSAILLGWTIPGPSCQAAALSGNGNFLTIATPSNNGLNYGTGSTNTTTNLNVNTLIINQPLVLGAASTQFTTGDGTMTYLIHYRIETF